MKEPDASKRMLDMSVDAVYNTPAEMAQFMKEERERWGNVIRATGVKME